MSLITREQIIKKYGVPNKDGSGYLVQIELPYPVFLNWATSTYITHFSCHHLIATNLVAVFNGILSEYGIDRIKELQLDDFGGCFNYRNSRNGSNLSLHAWGLAIDLDPDRNLLHETSKTARFARPEYKPMIDIFYDHKFVSLGKEKNYDWMHFQINE